MHVCYDKERERQRKKCMTLHCVYVNINIYYRATLLITCIMLFVRNFMHFFHDVGNWMDMDGHIWTQIHAPNSNHKHGNEMNLSSLRMA
jgi:hypothetical protein